MQGLGVLNYNLFSKLEELENAFKLSPGHFISSYGLGS